MITQAEDREVVVNGIEVLLRYPAPAPRRDFPERAPPTTSRQGSRSRTRGERFRSMALEARQGVQTAEVPRQGGARHRRDGVASQRGFEFLAREDRTRGFLALLRSDSHDDERGAMLNELEVLPRGQARGCIRLPRRPRLSWASLPGRRHRCSPLD